MQEAVIREIQQLRLLMGSDRDPQGRVFAQLADALRRNGELDEALSVVRGGVEEDPHFAPGHLVLGWVLQEQGDLDRALDAYRKAVELDPDNPFCLHGVGVLLQARGEEDGRELLERARELNASLEAVVPSLPDGLVPLHELPFLSLAELAPDDADSAGVVALAGEGAGQDELPFMTLAELAPVTVDAGPEPADMVEDGQEGDDMEGLPFMTLEELAPEEAPAAPADPLPAAAAEEEDLAPTSGEDDLAPTAEEAVAAPASEEAAAPTLEAPAMDSVSHEPATEEVGADALLEESPADATPDEPALEERGAVEEQVGATGDDATPATRTMAELLVSQNKVERALTIYEELLRRDPDNPDLAARIQELGEDLHPELSRAEAPAESGPSPFTWHEEEEEDGEAAESRAGSSDDAGGTAASYFGNLLSFSPGRDERGRGGGSEEPGGDMAEDSPGHDR